MPRLISTTLVASILLLTGCGRTEPARSADARAREVHGIDRAGMDTSVAPGDDFFRYANGAWLAKTEIPPDRSSYGTWDVLIERAQTRTRMLLEAAAQGKAAAGSAERKIGDYYASYLDEQAIDGKGLAPLRDQLDAIAAIGDKRALAVRIGEGPRADVDPLNMTNFHTDRLFGIFITQDLNEPSRTVPYLLQGGLGLPDRDYYVQDSARMAGIRDAYRTHIAAVLELAAVADADAKAARIMDLERRIAGAHATRTASADPSKAKNLPVQNALNFPAAILEPPYFDPAASAAARYGAIFAIIGHEISHAFDDQGAQFDASGRLVNWWTAQDLAHFKDASAKLVAQYNAYMPFPDLHVNGQLTLSENIADLAGLAAAYDGYRASRGEAGATAEDDRTFFISFGQTWRSKLREEYARQLVLSDGHALDQYRASTVRNLDPWYMAFELTPAQRLYLGPEDRVRVW